MRKGASGKNKVLTAVRAEIADVERREEILVDSILTGDLSKVVVDEQKRALVARRRELEAEAARLTIELGASSLTPEQEDELVTLTSRVGKGLERLSFAKRRHLLNILGVRVEVRSPREARLSWAVSPGLTLDPISWWRWRGRTLTPTSTWAT